MLGKYLCLAALLNWAQVAFKTLIGRRHLSLNLNQARFILLANVNAKRILTTHGCFLSECFAGVEHKSTKANFLLQICDDKICIKLN